MTPREKATSLYNSFIGVEDSKPRKGWMSVEMAKSCAVIAVDEILKGDHLIRTPLKFWEQVREEIINL